MMTQGVMTQAAQLFGNATGSVTSKGKQGNGSFELMMESTMKSGRNLSGNYENAGAKSISNQSSAKDNRQESDAVNGSSKHNGDTTQASTKAENLNASTQAVKQSQKAEDTKQTDGVQNTAAEEAIPDATTLEKIAGLLQAVQQTVMELLNLSSEELEQLLSEQGLSLVDLLQPENLQQLVLSESGATNVLEVLTDETLSDTMNRLMQAVEELLAKAELGMSPDQIQSLLEKARLLQEGIQADKGEDVTEEKTVTNQEANSEAAMSVRDTKEDNNIILKHGDTDKGIPVEVTKITDEQESSLASQSESRKDGQEIKATEQFEAFLNNLSKASTANQVSFNGNMVQVTEIREIANQIIERIRVTIQPEQTSMELQLNPEHLGKVNLSVQSKNGVMTAQFVVQNEISKEAIESQLHILKETLNQQGIKVDEIEVTIAAYSFQQNDKEGSEGHAETKKSHNGSKISMEEAIGMTEETEDSISQDITGIRGSQIDYTA